MTQRVITLTTDFGLADHYVGCMKGVILGIAPEARIVDISHEVEAFAIVEGAYLISEAYRYFPPGTVHVVVVDPGVGTARRPILAEAGGQLFVAPDNGVLSMVYAREKHKVREIAASQYFLHPVSRTFHGRDIFAPVGARLAAGVAAARFGKPIDDYVKGGFAKPREAARGEWHGSVLRVDRFGNMVTNFHVSEFPDLTRGGWALCMGRRRVGRLSENYEAGRRGELFVIVGSGGYLEVSLAQDSAARLVGRTARPVLRFKR